MGQILSDLSYNNKTLKPIGRPVDDFKALYKRKKEDYNYVIDSLNSAETALNNISTIDNKKDKDILQKAKNKHNETFDKFSKEGDFENKIPDTKRLANDLANKYGLLQVQQNYKKREENIASLQDRANKGEIDANTMRKSIAYSDYHYKGVSKDEKTGTFDGIYTPREVAKYISIPKEVINYLKGWKASTIPYKGGILEKRVNGYFYVGTEKEVTEKELTKAAKDLVMGDSKMKAQIDEEVFYAIDELNRKDGVKISDIQGLLKERIPEEVSSLFNIFSDDTLQDVQEKVEQILKDKGISNEEAYSIIKKAQILDKSIETGVKKESFKEIKGTYLLDRFGLEAMKKKKEDEIIKHKLGVVAAYDATSKSTKDDIKNMSNSYITSKLNLKNNILNYNNVNRIKGSLIEENAFKSQINRDSKNIQAIENRYNAIIKSNPDIQRTLTSFQKNSNDFIKGKLGDFNLNIDETNNPFKINEMSFTSLVIKDIGEGITDSDLDKYITIPNSILVKMFKDKFIGQDKETIDKISANILANGLSALKKNDINNAIDLKDGIETFKKVSKHFLKSAISRTSKIINTKAEANNLTYTTEYKTFVTNPLLTKAQKIANPITRLQGLVGALGGKNTSKFAVKFVGVSDIEHNDLKSILKDKFKVENKKGEIRWDTATVEPTISVRRNQNGIYTPVMLMTVYVKNKEKNGSPDILAKIPVFYDEPGFNEAFKETLDSARNELLDRQEAGTLSRKDNEMLKELNLNSYNLTGYSKNVDDAYLTQSEDKQVNIITYAPNSSVDITTYKGNSPQNFGFLATKDIIQNGEKVKMFYGKKDGKIILTTREELTRTGTSITAIGANNVKDLKIVLSELYYKLIKNKK